MAKCYKCEQEIGYWQAIRGTWRRGYILKNFWRKNLLVFDCPHCGIQCQETALTYYSFVGLFVFGFLGVNILLGVDLKNLFESLNGILAFLAAMTIANYLWWKAFAILKEPFRF